jgi:hypothetical protein
MLSFKGYWEKMFIFTISDVYQSRERNDFSWVNNEKTDLFCKYDYSYKFSCFFKSEISILTDISK